ncbi:MAG: response regulator [Rhodobacterales bacterium]
MKDLRILAVDDDRAFQMVLQGTLAQLGYNNVTSVPSAAAALKVIRNSPELFDGFLLDIEMPEVDGVELCRRIRGMSVYRKTPIIMVTSLADKQYVDGAFAAGATDYFTKPLDEIELRARLQVMRQLVDERQRALDLLDELKSWSDLPKSKVKFDAPLSVISANWMVEYLAMQNHLLTLSRLQLFGHAAIGFSVTNASEAFRTTDHVGYIDYLANIATVIAEALKTSPFSMAHAGQGDFVVLTNRTAVSDPKSIQSAVRDGIASYDKLYGSLGLPIPVIQTGRPVSASIFSQRSEISSLLDRARMSAQIGLEEGYSSQKQWN